MNRLCVAFAIVALLFASPAVSGTLLAWDSDDAHVVDDAFDNPADTSPDVAEIGSYASVAIGHEDGYPRVAYYYRPGSSATGMLKFAWYDGEGWQTRVAHDGEDIYQTGDPVYEDVGKYCALALDKGDNAHISYYNETRGELWYAEGVYNPGSGDYDFEVPVQLDPEPPGAKDIQFVGQYSDIAVRPDDEELIITYYDGGDTAFKWITRDLVGGAWLDPDSYNVGNLGKHTSVVYVNNKWFAVCQRAGIELLGFREDQTQIPISIDNTPSTGFWPSLIWDDTTGYIAVAYRSLYSEDLEDYSDVRISWTEDSAQTIWDNTLIVDSGLEPILATGIGTSLMLHPEYGYPLIGYPTLENWSDVSDRRAASRYALLYDELTDLSGSTHIEISHIDDAWRADPAWHLLGYFTSLGGYYNEVTEEIELWALYQDVYSRGGSVRRLLATRGHETQPQLAIAPEPLDFLVYEATAGPTEKRLPPAYGEPPESEDAFTVYLPTGPRVPERGAKGVSVPSGPPVVHCLVQLNRLPDEIDLARLRTMGAVLTKYHSGYAWWARVPRANAYRLTNLPIVRAVWSPAPADRLPRYLHDYLEPAKAAEGEVLRMRIRFHADVPAATAVDVLESVGATPLMFDYAAGATLSADVPASAVADLAASDLVMIMGIQPALTEFNATSSERSRVGVAAGPPWYLDGTGECLGIWDGASVDNTHPDLAGRAFIADDSCCYGSHATHVGGTIMGSGVGDPLAKGMAPAAWLYSYDWDSDWAERIDSAGVYGIAASNHSYGPRAGWSYEYESAPPYREGKVYWINSDAFFGSYSLSDARTWDTLIYEAEAAGVPMAVVFACGNDNGAAWSNQPPTGEDVEGERDYYLGNAFTGLIGWDDPRPAPPTFPPLNLPDPVYGDSPGAIVGSGNGKNVIAVGATYYDPPADEDLLAQYSSTGPTIDGRVKPDLVATGGWYDDPDNYMVWSTVPGAGYGYNAGTSMAAPVVTGICGLLAEEYANEFRREPASATLRALLCNTAKDVGEVGPDYKFGWGLADAGKAVKSLTWRNVECGEVDPFDDPASVYQEFLVFVTEGLPQLTAMLAWSDPEWVGAENTESMLVNKLRLYAIEPETGTVYYPWTLDGAAPLDPAVRDAFNTVDNVQQVVVDDPETGVWTVVVQADFIAESPQPFTLITHRFAPMLKRTQEVVLKNIGDGDLEVTGAGPVLYPPGPPPGLWLTFQQGWPATPHTLAPGEFTTIDVTVDPTRWDQELFPYRIEATLPVFWRSPNGIPVASEQYDITVSMMDAAAAAIIPNGVLTPGWNMFSIPVEPYDPEVTLVLDDLIAAGNNMNDRLFAYGYVNHPTYGLGFHYLPYPSLLTEMHLGVGYWLNLTTEATEYMQGIPYGGEYFDDLDFPVAGWQMWGYPFLDEQEWRNCRIRKNSTGEEKSIDGAGAAGWVQRIMYSYVIRDPSSDYHPLSNPKVYKDIATSGGVTLSQDIYVRPWYSYWLLTYQDDLTLVVPRPAAP